MGGWAGSRHLGGTGARPQTLGTREVAAEVGQLFTQRYSVL